MKFSSISLLSCIALFAVDSNVAAFTPHSFATSRRPAPAQGFFSSSSSETTGAAVGSDDPLGLTAELRKLTDAFQNIGDDKLRYKQLLHMASNGLQPMPEELKTEENKVLGCLSTVHVHAKMKDGGVVDFTGDSDGLLTKGLVALLVRGLSGNTPEDIQKVDPAFIQTAGISQSLTPGRNNGFLNMLALMKKKALEATGETESETAPTESTAAEATSEDGSDRPIYNSIMTSLQALQPTHLELIDNSHEHAGHAGNTGNGSESHFQLSIVADAFDGLNLVKRHQLIYMILGEVMPEVHALQITALTPEEADQK